jgi:hypothetical protein
MDFLLYISLGNEEMQTPDQLAALLRRVAAKLDEGVIPFNTGSINLTDANGNTVGFCNFKDK